MSHFFQDLSFFALPVGGTMTNRHSHSSFGWRNLVSFKSGFAGASATVLAVLVMTVGAQAQMTDAQKAAIKSSCRSDYISNCMSVSPGGIEALQCLQQHMARLSPGCRTALKSTLPPPKAALMSHRPQLTSLCKAALKITAPVR